MTRTALLVGCSIAAAACATPSRRFAPPVLWEDDDRRPIEAPEAYWSARYWDIAEQTVFEPLGRTLFFDLAGPAVNVNAWEEVPDSSWFVNRIGRYPMTPEQIARGPCVEPFLDPEAIWLATSGKVDGANPGFVIEDTTDGRRYLLKFDDERQPERATAADVIGSKVYWAFGFSTPCNRIVHFRLENLQLAPDASKRDRFGRETPLTAEDIAAAFAGAPRTADGRVRASSSLFLPGRTLGPFRYQGTRADDPNDVVPHEDRRELRASRLLAAWLGRIDAREQNSLTTFVAGDSGLGYVQHHIIDFGDCLGHESVYGEAVSRRFGHSYLLDFGDILADTFGLGLVRRPWETVQRQAEGPMFGYFDIAHFAPAEWKAAYPNPAFDRMDRRDGYWGAKIISRFSDAHIRALVAEGALREPLHARTLERVLIGRRDAIVREYLYERAPFEHPVAGRGSLCFEDLLVAGGYEQLADSYYQVRVGDGPWRRPDRRGPERVCVGAVGGDYVVVQARVRRSQQRDYGAAVRFHVARGEVIGIER